MRIRVVDAFTDRPFAGNPAAVCLLDADADERWMQAVAAEMNLSETAFALPSTEADYRLRWFTPTTEVDLCGHATLATAHALREDKGAGTTTFTSRSGPLTTHSRDDGTITLDFPAAPTVETTIPDGLAAALGVTPVATYATGALGDLLIELADEATVRGLTPDLTALTHLAGDTPTRGFVVTAQSATPGHDFVSRLFAPACGIPEDPVTGSAHTALAPFWSARLGKSTLLGLQVSARSGFVHTELDGDRVLLTGHAVTVLDGELRV
ncbi:PhzF family phenazine biosynthesis protein [Actinokineospora sp. HUAS TT18]|uniref:PhzF family phenazine biosynthesis protein n=1 Tax=Actinokineospora sp. HUAS TT18 TaxID=3447451 RepID=UPI003F525ADF